MIEGKGELDSTTPTPSPYYTASEVYKALAVSLSEKIAQGYHTVVGESENQYTNHFLSEHSRLLDTPIRGAMISLVEPRIPFIRQLELQGVKLDPAVFYYPMAEQTTHPSVAWVNVGSDFPRDGQIMIAGLTTRDRVRLLPDSLRAGSPMEAVGAGIANLLNRGFVTMPGGGVELIPKLFSDPNDPIRTLVAETYLECPRVSHLYRDQYYGTVGMLVVHQHNQT